MRPRAKNLSAAWGRYGFLGPESEICRNVFAFGLPQVFILALFCLGNPHQTPSCCSLVFSIPFVIVLRRKISLKINVKNENSNQNPWEMESIVDSLFTCIWYRVCNNVCFICSVFLFTVMCWLRWCTARVIRKFSNGLRVGPFRRPSNSAHKL